MRTTAASAICLLLVSSATLAAQDKAPELPAFRIGDVVDVGFRLRLQMDWRRFQPAPETPQPLFGVRLARIGLKGTIFGRVDYQIERDLQSSPTPWADVYANVPLLSGVQLRAGHFKVPFSLEQLTGRMELDFAFRSLAADYLAPGREIGAMVHGTTLEKRLKYQAGVFRSGGDNTRRSERESRSDGALVGGRLVMKPWGDDGPRVLSKLGIGGSATSGRVPPGPNSLRGHDYADEPLFHEVEVNGVRRRLGMELEWRYGPLSLRSERIHVADQRLGQGTDDDDLVDAIADGWYVSGTWLITGQKKTDRVQPSRSALRGGLGAIEVVARIEDFRFGSASSDAPPSADRRARTIATNADRAVTCGLNWYAASNLKLQLDVIREQLTSRGVAIDVPRWLGIVRVQVAL
jgi:phosphate-selective porin